MALFKKKIKRFEYKPRYYKGEGNPYQIEHKFDKYRTTLNNKGLKAKFTNAIEEFKDSKNGGINRTILYIIIILVLIFLYIIDFDLSIFIPNK